MRKKYRILSLLFVAIFIFGSFLVDRSFFNGMKDAMIREGSKIIKKIESKIISEPTTKIEKVNSIELTDDLMVFYLDVGQADAILIKSQNDYMLIDAGNNVDGSKLVEFFKSLGIKEFKYIFGTHAHEDHIGGMDNIIRNFKVKNFYMPDEVTTTQTYLEILDELEKKNIKYQVPKIGSKLKLGDSIVEIIYVGTSKEDLNDTSIIIKLTYEETSFLFTGDATMNEERLILDKDIESTVLKVGHHGSRYSTGALFLNKVRPRYAIISCGENNDYGHPHDVILEKLKKIKAKVYRTDKLGTIIAISDGYNISFQNIKTDTNGE